MMKIGNEMAIIYDFTQNTFFEVYNALKILDTTI